MTLNSDLIRVSLNYDWPGSKPRSDARGRLVHNDRPVDPSKGWKNVELPYSEVFKRITQEHVAICAVLATPTGHTEPYRAARNFVSHSLALVDIDEGMTIQELQAHPFYVAYGAGYYASYSHTEERHKFRVIFRLEQDITTAHDMRDLYGVLSKPSTQIKLVKTPPAFSSVMVRLLSNSD